MSNVLVSITQQPHWRTPGCSAIHSSEDRAVLIEAAIIRHNSRFSATMATIVSIGSKRLSPIISSQIGSWEFSRQREDRCAEGDKSSFELVSFRSGCVHGQPRSTNRSQHSILGQRVIGLSKQVHQTSHNRPF